MASKTKFGLTKAARDSYLELVLAFPLASIKSDEHLDEAERIMDRSCCRQLLEDDRRLLRRDEVEDIGLGHLVGLTMGSVLRDQTDPATESISL